MSNCVHERLRRKLRISGNLRAANIGKLRISIKKTNRHVYLQLIDDSVGQTVAYVTTNSKEFKVANPEAKTWCNIRCAAKLGGLLIAKVNEVGLDIDSISVYFDRGSFPYMGIVKEVADSLRSKGLKF